MAGELMHYGILGMKWGVRRERGPDGLVTNQPIRSFKLARRAKDAMPSNIKRTPISSMSNEQLREYLDRLALEKRYAELNQKSVSKGKKFVGEVLYKSGSKAAVNLTSAAMTYAGIKGLTSVFGKEVVDAMMKSSK